MSELWVVLTGLFGGLNIFQFIFLRAERKKAFAAAESIVLDNNRKKQDLKQDDYEYLTKKCDKLTKDYFEMLDKAQKAMADVSELKCEITYLKGLRCYKTICPERIQNKNGNENK
ncbi:hypothetical protein [Coprobacter tertius]|uniref:Uncharacterized protein n=1 Tax=Coprobacter tertius TaxID=2944915 RepID=A0ABT1MEU2_9BACT|nr:hypothetical protein [Coprobacter tertius]MCP9611137.1 hypothetical protein [Coprobacter tertius]